jgi:uncharacterized protein YndB with AHSA1/START domain
MLRIMVWIGAGLAVCAALLLVPLPWPDAWLSGHIVNRIEIAAPPERVFAYIATPANWPRWHPASRAVRGIVDHTPPVGQSVIETFEVAGRRDEATWTTIELNPPRRWAFSAASTGGGSARIIYTLTPKDGGTLYEREVTYRGPNLLFALLNSLKIRATMEADSFKALENVKRDVEAIH